jgi:hypothetical protein
MSRLGPLVSATGIVEGSDWSEEAPGDVSSGSSGRGGADAQAAMTSQATSTALSLRANLRIEGR